MQLKQLKTQQLLTLLHLLTQLQALIRVLLTLALRVSLLLLA